MPWVCRGLLLKLFKRDAAQFFSGAELPICLENHSVGSSCHMGWLAPCIPHQLLTPPYAAPVLTPDLPGSRQVPDTTDPLSGALDEADSRLSQLDRLLTSETPAVSELAQTLGACSSSADLVASLSRQRPGPAEPRAAAVRARYETLRAAAHSRLHDSEAAPLQWELDRWRLQQWLQHTASKLDNMPPAEALRRDDVQLRRFNVSLGERDDLGRRG